MIKKLLGMKLDVIDYHNVLRMVCTWLGIPRDLNFLHRLVDFIRFDQSINRKLFQSFLSDKLKKYGVDPVAGEKVSGILFANNEYQRINNIR